ncbi:DUF1036 domain-containing protein [Methylosinus trichosporium OB3b]|uniref:DUF1036 domain-containing protein n=3 Tax=Methylocystaceae TaxID=31993 RepID=A0A2D2CV86_METT3|nr:DUF1036 domain-containing protein [Methylosinus trichosporium OB3b]
MVWLYAAPPHRGAKTTDLPRSSFPMTKRFAPTVIVSFWLCATTAAEADFRMCNNTSNRVSVALAYTDGRGWLSEGWWNLRASDCETLLRGPLAAQYYYIYAMDERGGEWKGKAFMCTRDREFRIDGREDCFARGFDRTGFFEIDTGRDAKNWTVQLTDPTSTTAR